jgi:hypothetical protein
MAQYIRQEQGWNDGIDSNPLNALFELMNILLTTLTGISHKFRHFAEQATYGDEFLVLIFIS